MTTIITRAGKGSALTTAEMDANLTNLNAADKVVDRAYVEYTTNADLTTVIPLDDTIPQNTEGTQILSVSFTPKSATNRLRLRFQGQGSASAGLNIQTALFSSASANALRATSSVVQASGYTVPLVLEMEYVPGVTTAITFSVRVGSNTGGAIRLNGSGVTRYFGGSSAASLVIEEIAP